MDAKKLIVFTLEDDRRVIVNPEAIETIEESEDRKSVFVTTREFSFKVPQTMDYVANLLRQVSKNEVQKP